MVATVKVNETELISLLTSLQDTLEPRYNEYIWPMKITSGILRVLGKKYIKRLLTVNTIVLHEASKAQSKGHVSLTFKLTFDL